MNEANTNMVKNTRNVIIDSHWLAQNPGDNETGDNENELLEYGSFKQEQVS